MAKKIGRPSKFTPAIAEEICRRLAEGESLRQICLLAHMPTKTTVMRWLASDKYSGFRDQYARAREDQFEHWAEELLDISDDARNDWIERENERTGKTWTALNDEAIARARLRVDTRKWLLSKLAPKKYGDRVDVSSDGKLEVVVRYTDTDHADSDD